MRVATALSLRKSTRKVIVLRTPPDQIASAARLDCVRRPIRLRTPPDQIAFGGSGKGWGIIMNYFGLLYILATFVHIIV